MIKLSMWGKTEQVQTTGAQLFDIFLLRSKTMNGITFDILQDGGVHVYGTATAQAYMSPVKLHLPPGMYFVSSKNANKKISFFVSTASKDSDNWKEYSEKVVTVLETEETRAYLNVMGGITVDEVVYPMLNKGDTSLPWEPYSGGFPSPSPDWEQPIEATDQPVTVTVKGDTERQSVTLVPPRPLTKWDKLEKVDGVWMWVYKSGKEVLKGDDREGWIKLQIVTPEKYRFYPSILKNKIVACANDKIADIYCTSYIAVSANDTYTASKNGVSIQSDGALLIYDEKHATGSIADFTKALAKNPITIYYEAIDTEYIPLPQPVQDKLNSLTMYDGATEITNDGGCNMEIVYTVDTQSYVDTKIAEISKAML